MTAAGGDDDAAALAAEVRFSYRLAHELGVTLAAVLDMPAEEFRGWCAYFWAAGGGGGA